MWKLGMFTATTYTDKRVLKYIGWQSTQSPSLLNSFSILVLFEVQINTFCLKVILKRFSMEDGWVWRMASSEMPYILCSPQLQELGGTQTFGESEDWHQMGEKNDCLPSSRGEEHWAAQTSAHDASSLDTPRFLILNEFRAWAPGARHIWPSLTQSSTREQLVSLKNGLWFCSVIPYSLLLGS